MQKLTMKSRVGADGVVRFEFPLGIAEAGHEVKITIEPTAKPALTQEEWQAFIYRTAGSVTDADFKRHPQGEYETRESQR